MNESKFKATDKKSGRLVNLYCLTFFHMDFKSCSFANSELIETTCYNLEFPLLFWLVSERPEMHTEYTVYLARAYAFHPSIF